MTKKFEFDKILPALRAVARSVGADPDEGVSVGWLLMERAHLHGREAGWVVAGTKRVLARQAIPAGSVRLDVELDGENRFLREILAAPQTEIELWRSAELDPQTEKTLAELNSAAMAKKQAKTRRAVQQQVARQAARFARGDFFVGVSS